MVNLGTEYVSISYFLSKVKNKIVPSSNQLRSWHQKILGLRLLSDNAVRQLHDTKDRAHTDTSVEVTRTVNWVAGDYVSRIWAFVKVYDILLLFRDQCSAFSGAFHGGNEQIISNDIQLLLVVTGCV